MRQTQQDRSVSVALGIAAALAVAIASPVVGDDEIWVGAATAEITPEEPVALAGQRRLRIAREAATPLVATALAIEGRRDGEAVDHAILVSCDLVAIRGGLAEQVRQRVAQTLDEVDPAKVVLSATHTHTAPVLRDGRYTLPEDEQVMVPSDYVDFAAERVVEAISQAWQQRERATVSWGLDHAATPYNRRAVYADGSARMYGATDRDDFRRIEGYEDHALEALFFWSAEDEQTLLATAINVASPSQQVEGLSTLHADFWHPVRQKMRERHGDVEVLAWTGAAGDQAPRPMFRQAAERRMLELRGGDRLDELARRIVSAWEDIHEVVQRDRHADVVFRHEVQPIELTPRQISAEEYQRAAARVEEFADQPDQRWNLEWHQRVVDRYEQQQADAQEPYQMDLHVLRLGDVAIATNDFELFTDFGVQIKARSPAIQSLLIQLAGPGSYVPTERGVRGGGYSAIAQSNVVGPEGGQELVDHTVELIRHLWDESAER